MGWGPCWLASLQLASLQLWWLIGMGLDMGRWIARGHYLWLPSLHQYSLLSPFLFGICVPPWPLTELWGVDFIMLIGFGHAFSVILPGHAGFPAYLIVAWKSSCRASLTRYWLRVKIPSTLKGLSDLTFPLFLSRVRLFPLISDLMGELCLTWCCLERHPWHTHTHTHLAAGCLFGLPHLLSASC